MITMADPIEETVRRSSDRDASLPELLDSRGKPQTEKTAPKVKPRVSMESSTKQLATSPEVSATSKP